MQTTVLRIVAASGLILLSTGFGNAAPRDTTPDWPCQQRFVPTLTAGLFWSGENLEKAGDWRQDPKVAALVEKVAPRKVTAEEGEAVIKSYAESLKDDRERMIALAFKGLLDETNRQRAEVMNRIKTLARRQRELAEIASGANDALESIPTDATGPAAERRQDLELRRRYVTKAFDDGQRTIRYICEVPVQLEARLGAYARALQNAS